MSQNKPLKIAIYSPYLDTAGGGEKYMLTIAEVLSQETSVDLLLDDHLKSMDMKSVLQKMELMHGLNLSKTNLVSAPMSPQSSAIAKFKFLKKYDVLICNTDGSIFYSSAKRSYIHFQVPFENIDARGVKGKIKLSSWTKAVYNSKFTQSIIEKTWPIKGEVIYPPVSTELFKPTKKIKQILTVGRFVSSDKSKKQSLMIDVFKQIAKENKLDDWKLVLAGGSLEGEKEYIAELKKLADGANIEIKTNVSLEELVKLYGQSSIYWHAKGFGEKDPKAFEHFGISTVEGMAAECVPVVINLGGQKEIIEDGVDGYLWNNLDQLIAKTLTLIKNEKIRKKMAKSAKIKSENFDKKHFAEKINKLVYS